MFTLTTALNFVQQLGDEKIPINVCTINSEADVLKTINVKKFDKDSASPSTVYFGELVSKLVKNRLQIPISMKVFKDIPDTGAVGMKYEARLYQYITDNILKPMYSPNFIPFVAFGCCEPKKEDIEVKYNTIVEKIKTEMKSVMNSNLQPLIISKLKRFNEWIEQSSINENNKIYVIRAKMSTLRDLKLLQLTPVIDYLKQMELLFVKEPPKCFLITERAGNGMQFGLSKMYKVQTLDELYEHLSNRDKYAIVFQIVYSLAVMGQFFIVHNDLHVGNILVVDYEQNITLKFIVDNKTFVVATRYVPYIFDWDNGYTPDLGDNSMIKLNYKRGRTHGNTFDSRRDLYVIMCMLGTIADERDEAPIKPIEVYTGHPIFKHRDELMPIDITKEQAKQLIKGVYPFTKFTDIYENTVNIYQMSRAEITDVIGENKLPPNTNTFYFYIRDDELFLWEPFFCRPSAMSSTFPTPLEMLEGPYFDRFLEKEKHKLVTSIQTKEFVYTFPRLN